MNINRLKEFITLASCLNYSKAASQLYLTQPALSRHIHDIETTLGAPLFIRDTHNVHLTSVGELFYGEAKAIVERYEHALLLIKQAGTNTTGTLRLGFLGTASQSFLSEFVVKFTSSHPDIRLDLTCGNMEELARKLGESEVDVGITTYLSRDYNSELESEPINSFRLYVIMHPMHPLAERTSLKVSDLDGFPVINFSEHNKMAREHNRMILKKGGIKVMEADYADTVEELIFMVSINRGYHILPKYLLGLVPQGIAKIPLEDNHCVITLNLIWKKNSSNEVLPVFVKEFRTFMNNNYYNKK